MMPRPPQHGELGWRTTERRPTGQVEDRSAGVAAEQHPSGDALARGHELDVVAQRLEAIPLQCVEPRPTAGWTQPIGTATAPMPARRVPASRRRPSWLASLRAVDEHPPSPPEPDQAARVDRGERRKSIGVAAATAGNGEDSSRSSMGSSVRTRVGESPRPSFPESKAGDNGPGTGYENRASSMLVGMKTTVAHEPAADGRAPSPQYRASLRPLETTDGSYGSAEMSPEFLPGPARQAFLRQVQVTKAVEHVITAPKPTMEGLAKALSVSRATVYRIVAMPEFQVALRQQLSGRLSLQVDKALRVVEKTLDEGSPVLRLRAAQWLVERCDKLSQVAGTEPAAVTAHPDLQFNMMLEMLGAAKNLAPDDPELQGRIASTVQATLERCLRGPSDAVLDVALLDSEQDGSQEEVR